jgi:hypothetical protein
MRTAGKSGKILNKKRNGYPNNPPLFCESRSKEFPILQTNSDKLAINFNYFAISGHISYNYH